MENQKIRLGDSGTDDRRSRDDRRRNTLKGFVYQFVKPRRRGGRRGADANGFHVDFHEAPLLVVSLTIMSLCVVDVFATLLLLQKGSVELNPVMRMLIETDVMLFYAFKYLSTALGVFFLLSYRQFRIYKNFSSLHLLYGLMVVYIVLVSYEITLLYLVANR